MNEATQTDLALPDEMASAPHQRWMCTACLGARRAWRRGGAHLSCRACEQAAVFRCPPAARHVFYQDLVARANAA